MQAVGGLLESVLDGRELARLCQIAENFVVGAPCGIMDQMTSALGQADAAARPSLPACRGAGLCPRSACASALWGIDSGIRHAVSGSDYTSVRTGAFMGYRIIADAAGLHPAGPADADGVAAVDDPRWHGLSGQPDSRRVSSVSSPVDSARDDAGR